MVTDTAAAERMVDRLLAVRWDESAARAHRRSRGRLTREFLRRTAQWALAVGAEEGWPFSDLAGALDREVAVDPALLAKLEIDGATVGGFPIRPAHAAVIVRWAALGDLPRQRFPELDDPYEPLVTMVGRGGGYSVAKGFIELGYGSFPIGSVAERAALEPVPIDEATLDQADQGS
ncbi:hypothetical protein AB0F43_23780 [Kribbella sp. NPDC023972]|uniref:hypothetical protein n=1 Tax=Kribbella sp. NPDC023972 TaxID=3154795 RepID=UPI0034006039